MADVFICTTTYHFFITLVKRLTTEKYVSGEVKVKLILATHGAVSDQVINRTIESGLFTEVVNLGDIDDKDRELDYSAFYFFRHRSLQKQLDSFVSYKHVKGDEYYIYNDVTIMGKWLNSHRIRYNLIEDGLDNYTYSTYLILNYKESPFQKKMRQFFDAGFYCFGESKYMIKLEVNRISGLRLPKEKLIEVPRKQLFEKLDDNDRRAIADIYLGTEEKERLKEIESRLKNNEASLLITQPFYNDGLMSEKMQRKLYEDVVKQHLEGILVIKPHPRDLMDYSKVFDNAIVINMRLLPIEVFGYIADVHFKKVFTLFSTAVNNIDYCDEKIICGTGYIRPYVYGDKDFKPLLSDEQIDVMLGKN